MEDITEAANLEKLTKAAPNAFPIIRTLTIDALLNPDEAQRKKSIEQLDNIWYGTLEGGFIGDNQIFLKCRFKDDPESIFYVCDCPEGYQIKNSYPFKK